MTDSGALYRLMSWLSPNFPVGGFSYSHGLEQAVEAGDVSDAAALGDWIETVLLSGTGRTDGVLFREAWRRAGAAEREALAEIAELAWAMQPTAELALESRAQGTAFLNAARAAWPSAALDALGAEAAYPVAVALACAGHGIALEDALGAWFHGFAASLVSAGVRLIPLGQTDGQRTLALLEGAVAQAVGNALHAPFEDLGAAAPLLEITAMLHETQYTRLFRS